MVFGLLAERRTPATRYNYSYDRHIKSSFVTIKNERMYIIYNY